MKKEDDYIKQVEAFRAILNKALSFDQEDEIKEYLATEFTDLKDLFCQFIGFCSAELKDPLVKIKRHKIVNFMIALAMEGISLGRNDGYNSAKRNYFPTVNGGISA